MTREAAASVSFSALSVEPLNGATIRSSNAIGFCVLSVLSLLSR